MTRVLDAIGVLFLRTFALMLLLVMVFVMYIKEVCDVESE